MFSAFSQTVNENYKAENTIPYEKRFQIANGNTEELTISDPLLDYDEAAEERAKSEFLKNSYELREVRFKTYRTDFFINQTIRVGGLPYLVKGIAIGIDSKKITSSIRAVRYHV